MIELYKKYNLDKDYTSIWLFRELKNKYNHDRVLYPWSYVHITPSLIFSDVTYVDSYKNTHKFYEDLEVKKYIEKIKNMKKKVFLSLINKVILMIFMKKKNHLI